MRLITSSAAAVINRMWRNPPSVYDVTNPSTHVLKRTTKIVQSIFQLLSCYRVTTPDSLSAQILPLLFLVGLLLGFRIGFDRIAMRTNEFLSLFHNHFGALTQLSGLLIQIIKAVYAA